MYRPEFSADLLEAASVSPPSCNGQVEGSVTVTDESLEEIEIALPCPVVSNMREVNVALPLEQNQMVQVPMESTNSYARLSDDYDSYNEASSMRISRAGLRKLYKPRKNATYSKFNSTFNNRTRKSDAQVSTLLRIFDKCDGKVTKDIKEEAVQKTGLAWIQIYKWLFDHKVKKDKLEHAYCLNYRLPIFKITGKDGRDLTNPRPIFETQKLDRSTVASMTSGNPLA